MYNTATWPPDPGDEIQSGTTFDTSPVILYVETIEGSVMVHDTSLILSDTGDSGLQDKVNVTVVNIDIDIDSNMDGNPNNDDDNEMDLRAIIINVNNDSDQEGEGIDNQNGVIDGDDDRDDLTSLWLRKERVVPEGCKVILKVSDKTKLRIFDDEDTSVIGPPAVDGGPDQDEFEIPASKITVGDLEYLIECFDHGSVSVTLTMYDGANNEIIKDDVMVVLNVDRMPEFEVVKDFIGVLDLIPPLTKLEGIKAELSSHQPLISWANPRYDQFTALWIDIQVDGGNLFLQTGVNAAKTTTGVDSDMIYFEFVPDYQGWKNGTDPDGYQIYSKDNSGWTIGTFTVEVTNRMTGTATAFFNGNSWKSVSHDNMKTADFRLYQIQAELTQSVSRVPGTAPIIDRTKISDAQYKDDQEWKPTNFGADRIKILITDGKGNMHIGRVAEGETSASLRDFNFEWKSCQSFEIWDSRDW